jgi:hypothetical protein
MLVVPLAWHDSQAVAPTGTWLVRDKVTNGEPPLFVKLLPAAWQVAQPDVLPLAAWFIVQVVKPPGETVLVWQFSHAIAVVIWPVAGLVTTRPPPAIPT